LIEPLLTESIPAAGHRQSRLRRGLFVLAVLLAAAFFLPPFVNMNRFRTRIVRSMEEALGRKVTVESVTLRLLPKPGFELHRLAIADDPAFSAEPMLQADEVAATLRLAALWHGRLELASLALKSSSDSSPPSLNLVRAASGQWNISGLLQRAELIPSAPTAQRSGTAGFRLSPPRLRFPFLEADGGRINFKIGQEKTVYVLTDTDFALWMAEENEWAFRVAGHAVRTDFNLTDTGTLKMEGRFRRAPTPRQTPLRLEVALQDAQLGALTELVSGKDRGWRGTVTGKAHLSGTPESLVTAAEVSVDDFRRYDINTAGALRLEAQCRATYSVTGDQLSGIDCSLPLSGGSGKLTVRGDLAGLPNPGAYHFVWAAEHAGLPALVMLARHSKKDLPEDLMARGEVNAEFECARQWPVSTQSPAAGRRLRRRRPPAGSGEREWSGGGSTTPISLTSSVLSLPLALPSLSFRLENAGNGSPNGILRGKARRESRRAADAPSATSDWRLVFSAFRVPGGAATALEAAASLNRAGYELRLAGEARILRLLQLGRALGLRVPQYSVDGSAQVRLLVAGAWPGFRASQITGDAQLRDVRAKLRGFNAPLQISSAALTLSPGEAALDGMQLRFPGSRLQFGGSVRWPRDCAVLEQCPFALDLQSDEVSLDDLNRLLNPRLAPRAWYDVFGSAPAPSALLRFRAAGRLSIRRVLVKSIAIQRFSADAELQSGVLHLARVQGDVLGATHTGEWRADFSGAPPRYDGAGALHGLNMTQLAAAMRDDWAAGAMDARYSVSLAGASAAELSASLNGHAEFEWRDGEFRHVELEHDSGPLAFKSFTGQADWRNGALELMEKSKMKTSSRVYQVQGTVSPGRQLRVSLRQGGRRFEISGPLNQPKVMPMRAEEAGPHGER
jgi:hypothetical protein